MVRILSVEDAYTRECLALEADTSLGSKCVTRVLERLIEERGRPEDVAATVRFLCGPGARYINGQAIHANGGAYLGA